MTATPTVISGTSELTQPLPYPGLLEPEAALGVYCYLLRGYQQQGISLLVVKEQDRLAVRFSDWSGRMLDPVQDEQAQMLLQQRLPMLLQLQLAIGVARAQYYFSGDLLVDMRLSEHKFAGPGMLKELFRQFPTPEVLSIATLDQELLDGLRRGEGNYGDEVIVKPSAYRNVELAPGSYGPLYARVINASIL